jgi:hypothetical protein
MATARARVSAWTAIPFVVALAEIGLLTVTHGFAPGAFMLGVLNTCVLLTCCGTVRMFLEAFLSESLFQERGGAWKTWLVVLTAVSGVISVYGTLLGGDGGAQLQVVGIAMTTILTMLDAAFDAG